MRRTDETLEQTLTRRLAYDQATGDLIWRDGFRAGMTAGYRGANCYTCVEVDGRSLLAHRVAWFLCYGEWPKHTIDHINGDGRDNRIENLRDIPVRGNQQNITKRKDNTSGYLGVSPWRGKWKAQIRHCGRKIYLGLYELAEDAAASYELAKWALHEYQPTERGAVSHA